jgi:hypothetical protein
MRDPTAFTLLARGELPDLLHTYGISLGETAANHRTCSDGNIRYFEYENDKFEYLSEYKSVDPQRGIAFLPRRAINVSTLAAFVEAGRFQLTPFRFTKTKSCAPSRR